MHPITRTTRPQTLIPGERYLRAIDIRAGRSETLIPILLLAYTSCPAVVIVRTGCGMVERCARDDIYGWCDGHAK